ncbi:MarR family winged helix-turn-helix transcriptional regulator [Marinivivus vitaminiproducens]|uniref:MarR family winged helix-turn-helix transcriptional regulator n=1 Tax=Marinivivus vitaminiproducens TaxID=3035935 RepID=UPI0027A1632F|nr:MarR family transcriptional regulator [Geminicoccaceae bacterium SCSIO 64248]
MSRNHAAREQQGAGIHSLFLREEALDQGVELLYLAERCFAEAIEDTLARCGLTRAGHRALYFARRHPGLGVSQLKALLGLSKANLARLMRQLIERGLMTVDPAPVDRRQRLVRLTAAGEALLDEVAAAQRRRLGQAYRMAGADAVAGYRAVLRSLIEPRLRRLLPDDGAA